MENEQIVIELKELLYMEFRRYLYRRKANVTAQSILLAIGYNINKLHYKIQAGRTGRHLFLSIPIEISILFGNSEHPFPERKNMPFRSRVQPFI